MDMTEVLQPAAAAAGPAAGVEVIAQPDVSAFSARPTAAATAAADAAYAAAAAASDGSVLLPIPPAPAVSAVVAEPGSYPVVAAASSQLTAREPPPPYTDEEEALAAEARRLAEAEGLELIRSTDSMSGFLGVCRSGSSSKPYVSKLWTEGKLKHLGRYPTAEEASLAYARALGVDGVKAHSGQPSRPPKQPTMTAEQALAQAEQEGLELKRSESSTGFKGVSHHLSSSKVKPYQARLMRGGKTRHLGNFATAEEAALAHARALAGNEEDLPVPKKRPLREGGQGAGGAARKRKKKGDDEAYGGGLLEGGEGGGRRRRRGRSGAGGRAAERVGRPRGDGPVADLGGGRPRPSDTTRRRAALGGRAVVDLDLVQALESTNRQTRPSGTPPRNRGRPRS